jgi:hypothetical protein
MSEHNGDQQKAGRWISPNIASAVDAKVAFKLIGNRPEGNVDRLEKRSVAKDARQEELDVADDVQEVGPELLVRKRGSKWQGGEQEPEKSRTKENFGH